MQGNELRILVKAVDNASGVIKKVRGEFVAAASGIEQQSSRMSRALDAAKGAAIGLAKVAGATALAVGVTLSGAAVQASRAAFEQVRQVENASFALRAYEEDADKVNQVLADLVKYARSDLGVLFQREDLFAAASTLKMYGQETDTLVDKVKILSKGVSQGKTTFQELSQIIGRAAAKGRLDAVDFDMLIERGIGLDRSFRGAEVTAEKLFAALDKALPDKLLEDRANTIDGVFIRLRSAFRDLGSTILGVDKETSKFIEGGLGDRFVKGLRNLRNFLASPAMRSATEKVTTGLIALGETAFAAGSQVAQALTPKLRELAEYIGSDVVPKLRDAADQIGGYLGPKLLELWQTIKDDIIPILGRLWHEVLEPLIPVIGTLLVGALGLAIDALRLLLEVLAPVTSWMLDNQGVVLAFAAAFGTLKASLKLWDAIDKMRVGFETLRLITIPNLQASLSSFITFATGAGGFALVGAAAVAAAVLIANEWDKTNKVLDDTRKKVERNIETMDASIAKANELIETHGYHEKVGREKMERIRDEMQKVRDEAAQTKEGLDWSLKGIREGFVLGIKDLYDKLPKFGSGGQGASERFQQRATGGPVMAGEAYVVGERRAELFVPNTAGRIVPEAPAAREVKNILSGTFIFNNQESVDAFFNRLDKTQRLARVGLA